MADITITHTHQDGTLLTGSSKGDGVYEIARAHGFSYFPSIRAIGIRASRDKDAQTSKINALVAALRLAGHTATVDVDNAWRPAAVREADRSERVDDRVERLDAAATAATARADQRERAARATLDSIPFGQPLMPDHYSYRADRNRRDRATANQEASHREADRARELSRRADGAAANEAGKQGVRAMLRRIETLEAEVRGIDREVEGYTRNFRDNAGDIYSSEVFAPAGPERAATLTGRKERLVEEITHLRTKIDASGVGVWAPTDFVKGDQARCGGRWLVVTRVNAKSLSLDTDIWPKTMRYDGVFGRRRDGLQWNTPGGQPWPVVHAQRVARWRNLAQANPADRYSAEAITDRWRLDAAQRLVHGLPLDASQAELDAFVVALPHFAEDPANTAAGRDLAMAYLTVWERLAMGETADEIAATLTPIGTPTWRLPDGDPTDVRIDRVRPGDIVKGLLENGGGGRSLWRHFAGVVTAVSDVEHRREAGDFVTITLATGEQYYGQTHLWMAVYPAAAVVG